MILHLHSLAWDVASPSHYKLAYNGDSQLDVSYLGDQWCLFLEHAGTVSTRLFPTRDEAMDLVAKACRGEAVV